MTIFLVCLAVVLLVVGAVGTVYPVIPALPLMFGGAWLLAFAGDYGVIGTGSLVVLGGGVGVGVCDGFCGEFVGGEIYGGE